jgi:hypothetical protein
VGRLQTGTYVCAANNVQEEKKIELTVEFKHEVSVAEMFIDKIMETVTLVCIGQPNPRANVTWYMDEIKEGTTLWTKAKHACQQEHKFMLKDQMGSYTCTEVIEISGTFLCAPFLWSITK